MKILNDNKELVIFYLCVIIFVMLFTAKIDKENDRMLQEKNPYLLTNNI